MRYRRWPGHVTFFASPKKVTKERRPRGSPIAGQVKNRNEQSVYQDSPRRSAVPVVQSEPSPAINPASLVSYLHPADKNPGARMFVLLEIHNGITSLAHACLTHMVFAINKPAWRTYLQPPGEGKRRAGMGLYPGLALTETRGRRSRDHESWLTDCSFRFLTCPAIGEPRGRLSLVTFFGDAKKVTCSGHRRYHITCLVQA